MSAKGNDPVWETTPKVSGELFALTYGCFVAEVFADCNRDAATTNEVIEKCGYNIGVRFIDELAARTGLQPNPTLAVVGSAIADTGMRMLFGRPAVWTPNDANSAVISFPPGQNPLTGWATLPCADLNMTALLAGLVRGALEMVGLRCSVQAVDPLAEPGSRTELRIRVSARGGI